MYSLTTHTLRVKGGAAADQGTSAMETSISMLTNKLIVVGLVGFGAVALSVGCGSSNDSTGDNTATSDTEDLSAAAMIACDVTDDCEAIEAPACCPNGMKVAVNKHHVRAYENAHKCTEPPHVCPLFLIDDTRVAKCSSKGVCEMVKAPE